MKDMGNQRIRVIAAEDLPADPKPAKSLVAIDREKAEAILAVLEYVHHYREAPSRELVIDAFEAMRKALEGPELAMFQPWDFDDRLTGNYVKIEVSPRYSKLCINNRDYYFRRDTGEWDGTGTDFNG